MKMKNRKVLSLIYSFIFISFIFSSNMVYAEEVISDMNAIKISLNNLQDEETLSIEKEVKASVISINPVDNVEVYFNDKKMDNIPFQVIHKDDDEKTYGEFSYKLNPKDLSEGKHEIDFIVTDINGNSKKESRNITIEGIKQNVEDEQITEKRRDIKAFVESEKTSIRGRAEITKGQAFSYLRLRNSQKSDEYISNFVTWVWEEGEAEGIRSDIAFAQMMKETGFLKFGGDVSEEQNNFAGIGAVGGGVAGASFPTIQIGIRAVIQHLKAYACKDPLNKELVDPRFNLVTRGCAPYVEDLSNKWAAGDSNYGQDIVKMVEYAKTLESRNPKAILKSFKVYDNGAECNIDNKFVYNKKYTLVAEAESMNTILYQFWIKDKRTNQWTMLRDYSEDNIFTWTSPSDGKDYLIGVHVKDKCSKERLDDFKYTPVQFILEKAKLQSFGVYDGNTEIKDFVFKKGKTYTLRSNAIANSKVLYQFWIKDKRTDKWTMLRDYEENNTCTWTAPTDGKDYLIGVHVKDESSKQRLDDFKYNIMKLESMKSYVQSFGVYDGNNEIKNSVFKKGKTYTLKAVAIAESKPLYQFWIKDKRNGQWTMLRDFAESNTFTWIAPMNGQDYLIGVHVKDNHSIERLDDFKYNPIHLEVEKSHIQSFSVYDGNTEIKNYVFKKGKSYTLKSTAIAESKALYQFWIKDKSNNQWTMLRDFEEGNTITWTAPTEGQDYLLGVHVKDKYSVERLDDFKYSSMKVESGTAQVQSFKMYYGSKEITSHVFQRGKKYTLKATANGASKPLYQFWIKDKSNNQWTMLRDFAESNTVTWTAPTKSCQDYLLGVHIKDKCSQQRLDSFKYQPITLYGTIINNNSKNKKKIVLDAGHGNRNLTYGGYDSGAVGVGGIRESDLTQSLTLKLGQYLQRQNFDIIYTRDYLKGYTQVREDLIQRVDVANSNKADLFVSLHFDSSNNPSANGISTHYSSYKPNLDNSGLQTMNDIVYDRTPCTEAIKSRELSNLIGKRLAELGFVNRGSNDHNLYVTKNTNMPSLLIENGFVTNPTEANKIKDPNMQNKMAEKIGQAINDFFK
ncbi:N-acetylmuramoyl-L-alanine amidase [Hathewaya limosa]|uniref:N-acetylmuramoyl-L-alanine amidase n=2 Tax=Hathewaya limosa TaxID=1536 RepID=A0ABU0JML1_HATLI|nr:N-acetylmuramoyl-L-alanine amidase [Hathewaya limosa]